MDIVIDTETAGLDAADDEILTLGIVDMDGNVLFDGRFRPQRKRSWPGASRVNGIWPDDVRDWPLIAPSIQEISDILGQADRIWGYNLEFDAAFVKSAGIEFDVEKLQLELDPMLRFAEVYGDFNDYFGDYTWQKLTTAARYIGYDWGNSTAHGAVADAQATAALIRWLDEHGH